MAGCTRSHLINGSGGGTAFYPECLLRRAAVPKIPANSGVLTPEVRAAGLRSIYEIGFSHSRICCYCLRVFLGRVGGFLTCGGCQRQFSMSTRDSRSVTPSLSSNFLCSEAYGSRISSFPRSPTTRCHGMPLPEGVAAIALPAALAPPRKRKALASDPYVITRPRGISFTSRYNGSQDILQTSMAQAASMVRRTRAAHKRNLPPASVK